MDAPELELLICGRPEVDVADLRAGTDYRGYDPGCALIGWFWEVVAAMSSEDRGRLLLFITGRRAAPRRAAPGRASPGPLCLCLCL